jgi:hypothetical protein
MKNGGWSDDDLKTLRLYAEEGRSVYRIAAALNRTVAAIRSTAQRYGISIRSGQEASRAFRAASIIEAGGSV